MTSGDALQVEAVTSYARRQGTVVVVRVHLPDVTGLRGARLRLRHGDGQRTVEAAAVAVAADATRGTMLTARVPAQQLGPGIWRLALWSEETTGYRRLQARLVLVRRGPVALVAGPLPRTRMAPPAPRRHPAARPGTLERVARRTASAALERLPEERAARYRAVLVRARRRLSR
jgi:hypothetical protein